MEVSQRAQTGTEPGGGKVADREDLVRRYYGEALDPGRFELLDHLLTADSLDYEELHGIPPTRDGLKQKYESTSSSMSRN